MNFINRNEIANGVYFTNIKDSRFKTMKISVNIVVPLSVETASENALVGGLLVRSCKKYPDFTVLSKNSVHFTVQTSLHRFQNTVKAR